MIVTILLLALLVRCIIFQHYFFQVNERVFEKTWHFRTLDNQI